MDAELKDLLTRDRDKWRVTKQQPDGSWIAFVPRYPRLIGRGETFAEAGQHLLRLQKKYLEGHA